MNSHWLIMNMPPIFDHEYPRIPLRGNTIEADRMCEDKMPRHCSARLESCHTTTEAIVVDRTTVPGAVL